MCIKKLARTVQRVRYVKPWLRLWDTISHIAHGPTTSQHDLIIGDLKLILSQFQTALEQSQILVLHTQYGILDAAAGPTELAAYR